MHIHFAIDKFPSFNTIFGVELNAFIIFFQNAVLKTQFSMVTSVSVRKGSKGTDSRNVLKVRPEEILKSSRKRRNVTSLMRALMSAKMD